MTDANGNYEFTNLTAGNYSLGEVPQSGWTQTYPGTSGAFVGSAAVVDVASGSTSNVPASGAWQAVQAAPVTEAVTSSILPPQYDLENLNGYLTGPATGDPLSIAESYMAAHAGQLGLTSADLSPIVVTDRYTDADTGVTHLYFRQDYNGLEVSDANFVVNVTGDGRLINVAGGFVTGLNSSANSAVEIAQPRLTADAALQALAAPLGLTDTTVITVAQGTALGIDQATTLEASGFSLDPVPAKLHYVPNPGGGVVRRQFHPANAGWRASVQRQCRCLHRQASGGERLGR